LERRISRFKRKTRSTSMRKFINKKRALALGAVAALVVGASAFAFLSSTGTGSGTGTATATTSALSLSVVKGSHTAITAIGQTVTMDVTATNASGNSSEHISSIVPGTVDSPTGGSPACPAGSFTASNPQVTTSEVPGDGASHVIGTVDVTFNNSTTADQTNCLGSAYTVHVTTN
jgi:hypothetical protein